MQNPYDRMLDEFTPEGMPSPAQGDDPLQQALDEFTGQPTPTAPTAPTAPGMPVQPPRLTQTRTPREYANDELDAWWKILGRTGKNVLSTGRTMAWSLVQPWGDLDTPTGTSAWDRPAYIDAELRKKSREIWEANEHYQKKYPQGFPDHVARHIEQEWLHQNSPAALRFLWSLFPGWQDILFGYPFNIGYGASIKAQEKLGLLDEDEAKAAHTAFSRELADDMSKWNFTNPTARAEFKKKLNEGTALVDYVGDFAFLLSLIGGGASLTGKGMQRTAGQTLLDRTKAATTPAQLAKINKRLGLPADTPQGVTAGAIRHKMAKSPFAQAMDKASGYTDATNRFLNEGGEVPGWYNAPVQQLGKVPGFRDWVKGRTNTDTGRFQMKKGFADVIDPEMWVLQAGMRGISEVGTRALSPHADMWNKRMDRLFKSYGIDPKQIPASLMTRSEAVAQLEGMQLNIDEKAITEKLQTALRKFQAIAENIAAEFQVDGDLTKMGQALEKAFEEYDNNFSTWARHYRNTIVPGSENVVADLTPIFQLRQDMEIERQRLHQSGNVSDEPTMTRYLDDLLNSMKRVGQNELTPENIEAMKAGEPIQPKRPAQENTTVRQVRVENQLGMPHRIASSGDYKEHYQVEYEIIPRGQVVTSHNLDGTDNVLFSQITQALGYENLQPREFKGEFIRSIAADLQPMGYLADMRVLDRGAPIVYKVPEQIAESLTGKTEPLYIMLAGNNRTLAIDMARAEYPESAARYRQEMENEIGHYGYRPDDMTDETAMLFRVLTDQDANLQQIVDQSNTTAIRLFDAGEQSQKDLEHLNSDLLQRLDLNYNGRLGDILQSTHKAEGRGESNADVIFEWLQRFNPADRGNMFTTEVVQSGENRGQQIVTLTEQGVQRLVNALFRRTFDGAYGRKMMELFITRQDSDIKNIESGVIAALQDIADLQIGTRTNPLKYDPQYELAEDIAQAVVGAWQLIQEGQREGLSKTESLNKGREQGQLPGLDRFANEEQQLILDIIGEAITQPTILTGFIADYVQAVKEHGSPDDLFGGNAPPKSVLVEQLHHEYFFEETDTATETVTEAGEAYAPVAPLELFYRSQLQQDVEAIREQQKEQQATDIINDVQQLTLGFEGIEPEPVQLTIFAGLKKKAKKAATKVKRAVAPVMKSKRLVSIEWEGFVPHANRTAIIEELNKIPGVTHSRDASLRHDQHWQPEIDDILDAGEGLGYNRRQLEQQIIDRTLPEFEYNQILTKALQDTDMMDTLSDIEIQISKQNIRTMETKLRKVLDILKANNAQVNESTGFHVHVDKTGMTPAEMANIIFAWAKYEWAITQQPGWQNQYSETVSDSAMLEDNQKMQEARAYLEQHGGDINAALRAAQADPNVDFGVNTLSRASGWDRDVVYMEEQLQKQLQEAMKQGHSVMLQQTDHFSRLNVEGADAGEAHSIEFRQGEGTLDLEQAMKNAVFALHFVEKFKNEALKPGLRAPLSETMRRLQPDYEETDTDYYQRLYGSEKFFVLEGKRTDNAETLLAEWDADPNIAYAPQSEYDTYTNIGWSDTKPTLRQVMATLPAHATRIDIMKGSMQPDGTFRPEGKSITEDRVTSIPLPQTFDTNPLTTFGEVYDSPKVDLRIRKTFINLMDRVAIPVIGMKIESPRELAIVAQALRANFESTRIFFYDSKKEEIVGTRVVSLGKTAESIALKPDAITRLMSDTKADRFFYLHNHPGGEATFSQPDLNTSNAYKDYFGEQYIGQIVIDSGEYAIDWQINKGKPNVTKAEIRRWDADANIRYIIHANDENLEGMGYEEIKHLLYTQPHTYGVLDAAEHHVATADLSNRYAQDHIDKMRITAIDYSDRDNVKVVKDHIRTASGEFEVKNRIPLTEKELGWNPEPREKLFGGSRVGKHDPRFKGRQTREAQRYGEGAEGWSMDAITRSAVAIGKDLQTKKDWVLFAVMNRQKRLVALLEAKGTDIKRQGKQAVDTALQNVVTQHGGDHVFIYIGEGDWYKDDHEAINTFLKDAADKPEPVSANLVRLISVDNYNNPFTEWGSLDAKDPTPIGAGFMTAQDMPTDTRMTEPPAKRVPADFARNPLPSNAFQEAGGDYELKGKGQSKRSDGGSPAKRDRGTDWSTVLPPVTYGQVEAWRTYMRRQKDKHDIGTPEHTAAARMERALTETLERTMLGFSPEMWQQMRKFYELYHRGAVSIRSKAAKAIKQNSQVGLVEGTSNYAQMARSLFSPGDTPQNIDLVYQLIGGRDSEAGRQVRAIFLESLFEDARPKGATLESEVVKERTAEQRQALEQAQADVINARTPAEAETAQQRVTQAQEALDTATEESRTMHPIDTVNPAGLSGKLETWIKKTGRGYKRKTLDAILGKEVVDALIDLRDMEQSLSRLKAGARGSRTAPWITQWLSNDARRSRLVQVIETLALAFTPAARGGAMIGTGAVGLTMAFTGNPIAAAGVGLTMFIATWLGKAGLNFFMDYMQGKPVSDRYLLEGTVLSLDHVLTGTPVTASPEQAQAHREKISASDYSGMQSLSQIGRAGRLLPDQDRNDEEN